jgi:hypothetical protein
VKSAEEFEDDPSSPSNLSDSAERSDGIEDETILLLVPADGPPSSQMLFRMHLLFIVNSRDSSWRVVMLARAVLPVFGDDCLFASEFYILHMNQVGCCVIAGIFPDENSATSVMSRDDVNALLDFFKANILKKDGKCCDDGPVAFAQILNTEDTTDAARDAYLRLQTRMESINKKLKKLHPDLFRLRLRLDIMAALLLKELRVVEYGSVTCTVTDVVNQSNVINTCRNYCPILTLYFLTE